MAREARVVLETVPYHITQRGNNRQDVFLLDDDRRFYIQALRAKARQHGLTILGWRLMTNHVHLVAIPQRPDSLAKAVGQAHWRHTMRFNRRHGRGGHLCHGRFYSCPLGPAQLVTALAYVDLNPVRAGLAGRAEQYPCAVAHGRNAPADPLVDGRAWSVLALAQDWAQRLEVEAAGVRNAALRQATFFRAALWRREVHRGDEVDLGNGVTEITTFNSRLQPCAITAGSLLSLSFAYGSGQPGCGDYDDNNGNVREQKITGPGATPFSQTYDYDKVNRLLSVTEDLTNWSRVYSYDGFGNRALTGVGQGAAVGIQQPQALTDFEASNNRLKTAWADYDNAGNLTHFKYPGNSAFDWTAAYDAGNKQRWFCKDSAAACDPQNGNVDAEYRYDGEGRRVQKILDPAGTNPTAITYVYDAFGKLAAEYSTQAPTGAGGTFFRTTDHLGSTRLVTDSQGACQVWQDFYPFGERILKAASTGRNNWGCYGGTGTEPFEQEFTAKERDDETGLDYFGARYFSASLGRFTGPDVPLLDQSPANPQSWNLYGYVRNNSMTYTDPTGEFCWGGWFGNTCDEVDSEQNVANPPPPPAPANPVFFTVDAAGTDAALQTQQKQRETGYEHASSVYEFGFAPGAYTYTNLVTQREERRVDPNNTTGRTQRRTAPLNEPPIPSGAFLVAEAHSHPNSSFFSPEDRRRATDLSSKTWGHTRFQAIYLGAPDGSVLKYDPKTRTTTVAFQPRKAR